MKYLLDTHILLWAAAGELPRSARKYFVDENELFFSPASIWEIVIKNARDKSDFQIDINEFYPALLDAGYKELAILAKHAIMLDSLPEIHKDPFDRILIAQALSEKIDLITADEKMAEYPKGIIKIASGGR